MMARRNHPEPITKELALVAMRQDADILNESVVALFCAPQMIRADHPSQWVELSRAFVVLTWLNSSTAAIPFVLN
jgi:hypothetical protein